MESVERAQVVPGQKPRLAKDRLVKFDQVKQSDNFSYQFLRRPKPDGRPPKLGLQQKARHHSGIFAEAKLEELFQGVRLLFFEEQLRRSRAIDVGDYLSPRNSSRTGWMG